MNEKKKKIEKKSKPPKKSEVEQLREKCDEYLNGWKRAQADYKNLQKSVADERGQMRKFAAEGVIVPLLDIYSNFQMALEQLPEGDRDNGWVVGFGHIAKQLGDLLEQEGVQRIETVGKEFDPRVHEAVQDESSNKGNGKQIISKEVRPGYTLADKVIVPAKVIVG